jgi:2'-5' RNA ligase
MEEKFLCIIATFDEETSKRMKEIEHMINEAGMVGRQTLDIPHHITLAYFDINREVEIKQMLQDVCTKTKSFNLAFNHIGLFGMEVMFLAPDVNYQLLELHKSFDRDCIKNDNGWTAHVTILIDEPENIQKALPLVAQNFKELNARVESVSLYEFFPTRFIAECNLK